MTPAPFTRFCELVGLTLTRAQTVMARVAYDGADPSAFSGADRDLARRIFGDTDTIPAAARAVLAQVKGRDVGGTRLGAIRQVQLGCTIKLDRLGQHELAYCFFGAPKLRLSRVARRFALDAAERLAATGDIEIENVTADGFTIVRHDGRRVRFECFAASRGGDNIRGVPVIGVLLDEAAFYLDESTGVANDRHIFNAIIPRLLPGGQVLIVSSPWGSAGLLAEEFAANHGHPTTAIAAHCPTLTMRDDDETIANVARERARSPENARREFDAEFLTDQTAAWPQGDVAAAFDPLSGLYDWGKPFGVADPAETADDFTLFAAAWGHPSRARRPVTSRHSSGHIVEHRDDWGRLIMHPTAERPVLRVFKLARWTGPEVRAAGMASVVGDMAAFLRESGADTLVSDQRGAPYLAALLHAHQIRMRSFAATQPLKHECATLIRTLLRDRQLSITSDLPHSAPFRQQMLSYRRIATAGGTFKYTGGTRSAVDDWPAGLLTMAAALLEERSPTDQTTIRIDASPTTKGPGRMGLGPHRLEQR